MTNEKMVMMANQIATFFRSQPRVDQAAGIAAHISDFWEPRMRDQLKAYLAQGGAGLDPLVKKAAATL
ncbi:formate dehydrogenase subunit delta [Celeribacter indicus]|uniref:NAD-dependent formate dehydrogenase delta subunit FdsD n=1 Tax=Celeribacter indicus TaxID=1208324 RepID=A0A0B5DRV9_9RHOB|nr:formate dehydrogenase subunit delta [Celeribacter indicus]AJE46263.1 NAD-dependent formate dehydrogenase delta subunit FdsD [Celeribacter indicus]SDW51519.1 formate dehydrogenase delta subunit [Celeribacter indicus]